MRMYAISLSVFLFCFCSLNCFSQTPDQYYDLGRMQLKKEFTQAITINPKDIANLPYKTLSDAIALWVNGAAGNKNNIAYIIDGVALNDADAYSIYDIEKIVIVQNSLTQVSGANNNQLLAIITTRAPGTPDNNTNVRFASQAGIVSRKNHADAHPRNASGIFHQYYAAVRGGTENLTYGFSGNYVHDVTPGRTDDIKILSQRHFNLFRANGWAQAKLGRKNVLQIQLSYAPQLSGFEYKTQFMDDNSRYGANGKEQLFSVNARLQSNFDNGIYNRFTTGYTLGALRDNEKQMMIAPGGYLSETHIVQNTHNFIIADNFGYIKKIGNWFIEPFVNFSYQHFKSEYSTASIVANNTSVTKNRFNDELYTLTQGVSVSYKHLLNITGGFVMNTTVVVDGDTPEKAYPFISASANLINPSEKNRNALKLFASFAENFNWYDTPYKLRDFNYSYSAYNSWPVIPGSIYSNSPLLYASAPVAYNTHWQTGANFSMKDGKINFNYNFSQYENSALTVVPISSTPGLVISSGRFNGNRHQLSAEVKVIQTQKFSYTPAVYFYSLHEQYDFNDVRQLSFSAKQITGGIANRLQFQPFTAGIDFIYWFYNFKSSDLSLLENRRFNSLQLQNVFISYDIGTKKLNQLQLFAVARNLLDSKKNPVLPTFNKYFTIGARVGL